LSKKGSVLNAGKHLKRSHTK